MRILSLWQPWAQLMAQGLKTIETRSWSTAYRGPLAIHAAKKFPFEARCFATELVQERLLPETLYFGSILCVVDVVDVREIVTGAPKLDEARYGNYAPGRFAWLTNNLRVLDEPLDYKGGQGLRNLPDDVAEAVLASCAAAAS